jgi:hypothetical protein
LPRDLLPPDFRELNLAAPRCNAAERGPRLDRLELLGITDQDDLRTRLLGFLQNARELARAN